MSMATVLPFSDLIRRQTSVFPALDNTDVILQRRDGEDLVLSRAGRWNAMESALHLLARSMRLVAGANRGLAEEVFAEELPWLTWLPKDARAEAVAEILDQLLAGADTGQFMPFARALREWKSTAEIHSDPALLRRLSGPFDDLSEAVEIPMPPSLPAVTDGTGA